jgi:hypothetical protein
MCYIIDRPRFACRLGRGCCEFRPCRIGGGSSGGGSRARVGVGISAAAQQDEERSDSKPRVPQEQHRSRLLGAMRSGSLSISLGSEKSVAYVLSSYFLARNAMQQTKKKVGNVLVDRMSLLEILGTQQLHYTTVSCPFNLSSSVPSKQLHC